jgi:GPH family glycoside/pentoside/hexuronide:cation symporter/glucuronide carrier protein
MAQVLNGIQEDQNRIGIREKIAFGVVNIGNIPIMSLLTAFLMIFYTDVVGLNPAVIATLFLIVRVFDGLNDPIMGFVIDHLPRTKLGRFRTYLIIGCIVCSVNFLLVWFGPVWVPAGKVAIAYITYILIGVTFDMMDIPLNSMIPVMTDVDKERNILSAIKGLCYMIGVTAFSMSAPLILAGAKTPLSGYYVLIFAAIAVVLVFTIVGVLGIKERIEPLNTKEKYKLKDVASIVLSGPVLATLISSILFGINLTITNSSGMYFVTYILDHRLDVLSLTFLLSLAGMLPAMALSTIFSTRFGKKPVFITGYLIIGIAPLLRLLSITNIPLLYVATIVGGIGSGLAMTLTYGIQADNVDYVEYARGQRTEGCIASLNSFVVKAGMGVGGAILGYILSATGYVANAVQSDGAKTGIIMSAIVIPALLALLSALVFGVGYKINKAKLAEITQGLRNRRTEKAQG